LTHFHISSVEKPKDGGTEVEVAELDVL